MNSAYRTTLLMVIIAGAAAAAAASVYPWPKAVVVSDAINKPLFEEYDTRSVRSIRISQYNEDRNSLESMLVRRKGEKWIIPGKYNFIANNGAQVSAAANLLIEKIVLDKQSDDQQDHVKYGVIDPADFDSGTPRSSLGKKIVLEDRNKRELANLIIGSALKNDPKQRKHYVRIPGQPSVYVIEIDDRALNTQFAAWVDPNLLGLKPSTRISDISIENYRLDAADLEGSQRQPIYATTATLGPQQLEIDLKVAKDGGELTKLKPSDRQRQTIQRAAGSIGAFRFSDVQPKSAALVKVLAKPQEDADRSVFESALEYGFVARDFANEAWQFDGVGGEIVVRTGDAVVVSALIGSIDNKSHNSSLKLNHYLMLVAGVDESLIPEPEKPASSEEESADQNKAYLRQVAQRDKQLQAGRQQAAELNRTFANWYYVVSEDMVAALRPELSDVLDSTTVFESVQPAE